MKREILHYLREREDGNPDGQWVEVVVEYDQETNSGEVIDAILHDHKPDMSGYGKLLYQRDVAGDGNE